MTEDGRYLIITVWRGTEPKNQVFYQDSAGTPDAPGASSCSTGFDADYDFLGNDGPVFWFVDRSTMPRCGG